MYIVQSHQCFGNHFYLYFVLSFLFFSVLVTWMGVQAVPPGVTIVLLKGSTRSKVEEQRSCLEAPTPIKPRSGPRVPILQVGWSFQPRQVQVGNLAGGRDGGDSGPLSTYIHHVPLRFTASRRGITIKVQSAIAWLILHPIHSITVCTLFTRTQN